VTVAEQRTTAPGGSASVSSVGALPAGTSSTNHSVVNAGVGLQSSLAATVQESGSPARRWPGMATLAVGGSSTAVTSLEGTAAPYTSMPPSMVPSVASTTQPTVWPSITAPAGSTALLWAVSMPSTSHA
jgi:hypothetical protein